ncbi:MAG: hypothetical protein JWR19_2812 [Pedosphaera sp.]|nr:hypothetical protein [Pedosphaera sp.]
MAGSEGAMNSERPTQPSDTIQIGPDRVTVVGEQVFIDAAREMGDWTVREFCRLPIYYRHQKYFLLRRDTVEPPYAMRYVLEPWPANNTETSRHFVTYDEEYVAGREAAVKGGRREAIIHAALMWVYPFLGLLWSGPKEKLNRFGFIPRSITSASMLLVFGVIIMEMVLVAPLIMATLHNGWPTVGLIGLVYQHAFVNLGLFRMPVLLLDVGLFLVLVVDSVVRYCQHLDNNTEAPWGFLEWVRRVGDRKTN